MFRLTLKGLGGAWGFVFVRVQEEGQPPIGLLQVICIEVLVQTEHLVEVRATVDFAHCVQLLLGTTGGRT